MYVESIQSINFSECQEEDGFLSLFLLPSLFLFLGSYITVIDKTMHVKITIVMMIKSKFSINLGYYCYWEEWWNLQLKEKIE